jgi:hypothetical protein
LGSYTLPPFALYKPSVSETGWGALADTNYDLLAANSNAQLALGMFDYIITYGDIGDGAGVQARAINLRTYSVVASNSDYATVHNALVDSLGSTGANVLVRSAVSVVPLTTSLRFNKYSGGTWTITPGQWVFGGRSFRFQAVSVGWTNGPNGSCMFDLEAGGVAGTRGGKKLLYGPFCDANNVVDTCYLGIGKGTPSGSEGDTNYLIGPIGIKFLRSGIAYGTAADAINSPPNGSANMWSFAAELGDASCSVGAFEFNVGDGQVLWSQITKPGAAAYYCNAITTTVIGGHATLDSSVAGYIAQIAQGSNFSMDDVYFDNIAGSNLGAVGVVAVDPGGVSGIGIAATRVRVSNSHFNMNAAVPIFVIDNAAAVSGISSFTLRNANAPGQSSSHTSAIVNFKDMRGSGSSISASASNAIAASMVIDGGTFTNTDKVYTVSGTTDAAARPTVGRISLNGGDVSQVPIKAGVPADADYVQAFDGLQCLDVSGNKMYVRVGGVWTALN